MYVRVYWCVVPRLPIPMYHVSFICVFYDGSFGSLYFGLCACKRISILGSSSEFLKYLLYPQLYPRPPNWQLQRSDASNTTLSAPVGLRPANRLTTVRSGVTHVTQGARSLAGKVSSTMFHILPCVRCLDLQAHALCCSLLVLPCLCAERCALRRDLYDKGQPI